ncbi:MAG: B12-binding domain-containing radical SAM protein [Candidatus Omnitrophica bacterium]|nr:B12-binding domain-containing radical SAM protein [Candidatus Omnitrophota bacterium]
MITKRSGRKKVILVKPHYAHKWDYRDRDPDVQVPTGLLYVGTTLKANGYDVKIIDATADKDYKRTAVANLDGAVYVGITAMTAQLASAIDIAGEIRKADPEVPLVWGGNHPSLYPEQTCLDELCDIAVIGEGDMTAVELAGALEADGDPRGVKGICFRRGGEVVTTGGRGLVDVEALPEPDYGLLGDVEKYIWGYFPAYSDKPYRFLPVHAGRGCFYRCSFCMENVEKKHRSRTARQIADQIKRLMEKYRIEAITTIDSDFYADKKRVKEFVDIVINERIGIKWMGNSRANYFRDDYIDREFAEKLEISGCFRAGLGVETGSTRILEYIRKDITHDQVRRAVDVLNTTGIIVACSFMIGIPGETKDDMVATFRFIRELYKKAKKIYIIGPAEYRPYPGCDLFEEATKQGLLVPDSLRGWGEAMNSFWGYLGSERFPWVEDHRFIKYATTVIPFLYTTNCVPKRRAVWPLYLIVRAIVEVRVRFDLWGILFEDRLILKAASIWQAAKPVPGKIKEIIWKRPFCR